MADLELETYDVCLGLGPQDPARTTMVTGLLTKALAEQQRAAFDALREAGAFSTSLFVGGRTFFVRTTPGAQSRASAATTRAELRTELRADPTGTVVLYARQLNPEAFLRVAAIPVRELLKVEE